MQKYQPFFSIIIPTHKRANLLERALTSIKSQDKSISLEIIVVSDAIDSATDVVCANLLDLTDTYIRRSGLPGPSESRNLALSLAKGNYVIFLDDDDAWQPNLLSQLYSHPMIKQHEPIYFNCKVITERRKPEGPEFISEIELDLTNRLTDHVYIKNQVHMSCFAFPRNLITGIYFDVSMRAYEDWDYLLSIFDRKMPMHIPIQGSRVYEVRDDTTDRRGSSTKANDFNAVLDYLYVYRRHTCPTSEISELRAEFLNQFGLSLSREML